MAKPANGEYELTGVPSGMKMRFRVDDQGGEATFGRFIWDEPEQAFYHVKADLMIQCTGGGTFVAIVKASTPEEQVYSGTCVPIP